MRFVTPAIFLAVFFIRPPPSPRFDLCPFVRAMEYSASNFFCKNLEIFDSKQ
jgi:hypothetical protein